MDYRGHIGDYLLPEDTKNGICIDVGANYGNFIKKNHTNFKEIHYIEPLKHVYDFLNSEFENYDNVFGYNKAVWSESNKPLRMVSHLNNDAGSAAVKGEFINDDWTDNTINEILSISIEELIDKFKKIDYLKVDCETSEYPFLFNKDLTKIRYIGIELHNQLGVEKYNELVSWIKNTHDLVYGDDTYTFGINKEVLYKLNDEKKNN